MTKPKEHTQEIAISPKYTTNDLNCLDFSSDDGIDLLIKIHEDRLKGWFLDCAKKIERFDQNDGGAKFIILHICMAYVEGQMLYQEGICNDKYSSSELFRKGIKKISYDDLKEVPELALKVLYKEARCGLFHEGMTKSRVILFNLYDKSIDFVPPCGCEPCDKNRNSCEQIQEIRINPYRLLENICEHFDNYIIELRNHDNKELRENLSKVWKKRVKGKKFLSMGYGNDS